MKLFRFSPQVVFVVGCFLGMISTSSHAKSTKAQGPVTEIPGAKTVVFREMEPTPLRLHIFNPPDFKPTDKRPALVLFFGGGWAHGNPTQFVRHANYFASRGMVVILPDYRTRESHKTSPFECIADGKAAMRWVRTHAKELGIDPDRIAAGGGSAGGHVAASTAILSNLEETGADTQISCVPNALILFNPVLDTSASGYGSEKFGGRQEEGSPIAHVRSALPPTIIFHGRADTTAPFENSERFAAAMKTAGNTCTLFGYDGQKHGFYWKEPYYSLTMREADLFLISMGWLTGEPTITAAKETPVPQSNIEN